MSASGSDMTSAVGSLWVGGAGAAVALIGVAFVVFALLFIALLIFLRRRRVTDPYRIAAEAAAPQILETMKSAVIVVDMEGRIRIANRAAAAMLGYELKALIGQHVRAILPRSEDASTERILHSGGILEQAIVWRCADGSHVDVLASSSFVRDSRQVPLGVVYVAADFTERKRAEAELRASEERYRALFELNPLPMWVFDLDTLRFSAVNDAAVRHYGFTRAEFLRMKVTDIRPAEEVEPFLERVQTLEARSGPVVARHRKKDGATFEAEVTSFAFADAGRTMRLVIAQDITERRKNEDRYRLLFERNLAGVYRTTIDGRILDCNDALAKMFGYADRADMLAHSAYDLYTSPEERHEWIERLRQERALSNVEVKMRRRDGSPMWILENVTLMGDGILQGTLIDITERKTAHEVVEYHAYHDALTGLPNRLLFRDRITVALPHARRMKKCAAVMFLDLDDFKIVNDTLGHTVGDGLLEAIASRLSGCVRAEDTVARMGGDEFTILLSDVPDRYAAAKVAQKVLDAIQHPVQVDDHELYVSASVGIAMFPEDGDDAESLLREADRAMYRAKDQGRNNFAFATAEESGQGSRLELERSLHHALEREEFVVFYQPIVEILTGRVAGAEALVRWNNPSRGLMNPEEFISLAEACNLILPLGEWVLRTACRQMKAWRDAGFAELRVAVNISFRQLQQRDFPAIVERVLEESGLPPAALDLEITESGAMQNIELTMAVLNRVKELGVSISIDDFGTGYSSLSYLKRFPIDTVKIDQHFVRDATEADAAIISAVISIARALRLNVVAEGVETAEQMAFLREANCPLVQGFLHSEPVTAAAFHRALVARAEAGSPDLAVPS